MPWYDAKSKVSHFLHFTCFYSFKTYEIWLFFQYDVDPPWFLITALILLGTLFTNFCKKSLGSLSPFLFNKIKELTLILPIHLSYTYCSTTTRRDRGTRLCRSWFSTMDTRTKDVWASGSVASVVERAEFVFWPCFLENRVFCHFHKGPNPQG
jgi:hypothetical protein